MSQPRISESLQSPVQAGAQPSDDAMYRDIYRAIVEHHLAPGAKLPEDSLAEVFGVSRTRINKVLQRLAHENIVTLQRNRGAFVAQPSAEEAREIFEARRILESGLVAMVARRATREQIAELRDFVAQEAAAKTAQDRREEIGLSGEFHLRLARTLGNATLAAFLHELMSRTSLIIAIYDASAGAACSGDEHERLVALIEAGDEAGAVAVMIEHLDSIESKLDLSGGESKAADLQGLFRRLAAERAG